MYTVREKTIVVSYEDDQGQIKTEFNVVFLVCNGDICFEFNDEDDAKKFCKMLNWLLNSGKSDEIDELYRFFVSRDDSFFIKQEEYDTQLKQEEEEIVVIQPPV